MKREFLSFTVWVIFAKFPSFEEVYALGNRFYPMMATTIREIISLEKVKEIVLAQAAEAVEQEPTTPLPYF